MSAADAYRGLKILDLSQGIAGPYCAMLFAMRGAEVVKLEPLEGDWSRGLGARYGDHTAMSAHNNRGKRSLALDLKAAAGRDIACRLAAASDIVIESFRPGVAARLGLGYKALADVNPRLLYLSISGFGDDGPYAQRPCTDSVAQAYSGLAALNRGNDGAPHRVGAIVIDTLTGVWAAQTLGAALYARERSGKGERVTVTLAECAAALLGHKLAEHALEKGRPRALNVPTGSYATKDGFVIFALVREIEFPRLCAALGRPDLAGDPRFADFALRARHAAPLVAAVAATLAQEPTAHWLEKFRAADLLADRVNGFEDWLADPHIVATGGAVRVEQPGMGHFPTPRTPGLPAGVEAALPPAPRIGEHGRAILAELGLAAEAVARLAAEGVLRLP
ncbi:MAG TPA: CoA transferase [Stellaceae bacterium]|nr:CoA transferase [Stellaceae bacterium]